MPAATSSINAPQALPPQEPPRKLWTRVEYQRLIHEGFLDGRRVELVNGELISKMGRKRPHTNASVYLYGWLLGVFGGFEIVNQDTPIDVGPEDNLINEPEPDIIVLTKPSKEFRSANPAPSDLRLVVDISDSLKFDLRTKALLYARAGIVEYWVLDVAAQRLVVHRNATDGRYKSAVTYSIDESVAPLAAPQHEFRVRDAFPE